MQTARQKRREFLNRSIGSTAALALGCTLPETWVRAFSAGDLSASDRVLVVVQLSGGNDGLNTVVPFRNADYRKARPKLAIKASDVLKIDADLGFHPSLPGIHGLLQDGRFTMVQGVGYPSPNRSHFESMDIWHSCHRKDQRQGDGWLGRWMAAWPADAHRDAPGLHLGNEPQPIALSGRGVHVPSVASIDQFRLKVDGTSLLAERTGSNALGVADKEEPHKEEPLLDFLEASTQAALEASQRLEKAMSSADQAGDFPASALGQKLRVVARLILAGIRTRVYYVALDGFDTHSQQPLAHASLLRQWSEATTALVQCMKRAGQADRVLVMAFSEFGRRVAENASEGTDHGAAAPVFFAGPSFPRPMIGAYPNLTDLEDGDLRFHTDFRQVYATVIETWLGGNSQPILGGRYSTLDLL
jgi:uncharacterized protein (DUF1501 family)